MELPKVFIFTIPATGHINTILSVTTELVKQKKCHVVLYSANEYKNKIELTGAEFRSYKNNFSFYNLNFNPSKSRKSDPLFEVLMKSIINVTNKIVIKIAKEIDDEKPVVVIYDQFSLYAKYAIRMIQQYKEKKIYTKLFKPNSSTLPQIIRYYTTFSYYPNVYPNKIEFELFSVPGLWPKMKLKILYYYCSLKQYIFCLKYKLKYVNPFSDINQDPETLNLVFISPFIQPRSHLFGNEFKFVGACINESVHHDGQSNAYNEDIENLLNLYEAKNPVKNTDVCKYEKKKFIYVCLGTFHNNNKDLIKSIIDAFVNFDENDNLACWFKLHHLDIVISIRKNTFEKDELLNLPKNIYFSEGAPQLEILKCASLFITHCGMNSISEAVHFGVPLLCIPLAGDQQLISYRVAIELGLGIELSFFNIKPIEIRKAVKKLLMDNRYHERILLHSKLSRKFNGGIQAAEEIIKFAGL